MDKYGLHNCLTAKKGETQNLAKILIEASELMSNAKGCYLYSIGLDETRPNTVWISEIWDTKEDHDQSLGLPGVRELIGSAMPLIDGKPETGQELKILGGHGVL